MPLGKLRGRHFPKQLSLKESLPEVSPKLFDIVEIACSVVNELVGYYRDKIEEPFGYVLAGLEDLSRGTAKLYTIFGAGLSDVPWACLGSGSAYARSIVDLLLTHGDLKAEDVVKAMPSLFSLVSSVQTTVGGGVNMCIVKDGDGTGEIWHTGEVNLKPLRSAILEAMGIRT